MMTHGSLFSGIGGFDLAAEWMGWENLFHCERNPFGQTVLKNHWPSATSYEDITKTAFSLWRGRIDILTGGFPCQPYSNAGKRLGKEDERHLWPQMLRAIREIQPRWVVGENVRGLTNWNGGVVFDEVQADLETEGYQVLPFLLPACAKNAPHRRDRIWFIAFKNTNRDGRNGEQRQSQPSERLRTDNEEVGVGNNANSDGQLRSDSQHEVNTSEGRLNALSNTQQSVGDGAIADATSKGREEWIGGKRRADSEENRTGLDDRPERFSSERPSTNASDEQLQSGIINRSFRKKGTIETESRQFSGSVCSTWQNFPTQSPVCDGDDGFSYEPLRQRLREDSMGHLSEKEIDKILSTALNQWRKETIKAGGNAIVPQVALEIFKAIDKYEKSLMD